MTDPIPFAYDDQEVRSLLIDDSPWFVANDVAKILGYRMASDMTRRLDPEDRGTRSMRTPSGEQGMTVISEPGLYSAVLGSQVEGARDFKRWVVREVLPAIRKTGGYSIAPQPNLDELSPSNLEYMAHLGRTLTQAVVMAQANQKKADAFDQWLNGKGCYKVGTVAKMIGVGPQKLFDFLYAEKILIEKGSRRREPFSKPALAGWFEVKPYDPIDTNGHSVTKTGVTPYGAEQIRLLAIKRGLIEPSLLALTGGAGRELQA